MLLVAVKACGPDFEPEVFVSNHQPETPRLFADGHLGALQNGYYHAELVVAYRYLLGGKLSDAEMNEYAPPPVPPKVYTPQDWKAQYDAQEAARPINRWLKAREDVHATPLTVGVDLRQERIVETPRQGWVERDEQLNCPDAAFTTALDTLQNRLKTWGAGSADLQEWLRGQDTVFSNCAKPGTLPAPAQPSWTVLLKQDRTYQIAAAKFYATDYDSAIVDFVAIGKDKGSPWSRWGEYLAARAQLRRGSSSSFFVLETQQRYPEAEVEAMRSAAINPFEHPWELGTFYISIHRYGAALKELNMRRVALPNDSAIAIDFSKLYWLKGMYKESQCEYQRGFDLQHDSATKAAAHRAWITGGEPAVERWSVKNIKALARKQYFETRSIASTIAFSGDKDETMKYLEASYRMHDPDLIFIQNEPLFDFLHSEPRYRTIVNKMGLPPAY